MGFYNPTPGFTNAYHNDGTHEYFGKGPKGAKTSDAQWSIFKMEYDTGYDTAGDNWIIKYPDGTDAPKFIWDNVESLTYKLLGQ